MATIPEFPALRASALPAFADCPRRALVPFLPKHTKKFFGIAAKPSANSFASVIGTGLHKFAETGDRQKGLECIHIAVENEALVADTITDGKDTAVVQLRWMIECFDGAFPHWRENAALEERVELNFDGVKITGTPDRIAEGKVYDIKTTARTAGPAFAAQMGAYIEATGADDGAVIVIVKRQSMTARTSSVKTYELATKDCKAATQAALDIARDAWHKLWTKGSRAIPANPSSALCSPQYCPAHGTNFCPITKNQQEST